MKIKFNCPKCNFHFEKTEEELKNTTQSFRHCSLCGTKLSVENVKEIVTNDLELEVHSRVNEWFKTLGIEYTLELIGRHKDDEVGKLYVSDIKKRGLNV